jgi:hypothetical protein
MANRYQKDVTDESVGPDLPFEESLGLAGYSPENARKFALVAAEMERLGYDTYIGNKAGMRTPAEDAANKAKKISGKLPSKHLTGEAIDLRDKRIGAEPPSARSVKYARDLGAASKSYGLGWGGDWFTKGGKPASWSPGIGWDPHHIQIQRQNQEADAAVAAALAEKTGKVVESVAKPVAPHDASNTARVLQTLVDNGYDYEAEELIRQSVLPRQRNVAEEMGSAYKRDPMNDGSLKYGVYIPGSGLGGAVRSGPRMAYEGMKISSKPYAEQAYKNEALVRVSETPGAGEPAWNAQLFHDAVKGLNKKTRRGHSKGKLARKKG